MPTILLIMWRQHFYKKPNFGWWRNFIIKPPPCNYQGKWRIKELKVDAKNVTWRLEIMHCLGVNTYKLNPLSLQRFQRPKNDILSKEKLRSNGWFQRWKNVIFSQKKISRPIELHIKPTSLRRWNLFEMGLVHIIHFQTCKITCQLFIHLHLLGLLGLHLLCKLSISNHWGFHINFSSNCISMAWGLHPPLKLSISNHWGFHITFHLFTFRWPLRLN